MHHLIVGGCADPVIIRLFYVLFIVIGCGERKYNYGAACFDCAAGAESVSCGVGLRDTHSVALLD